MMAVETLAGNIPGNSLVREKSVKKFITPFAVFVGVLVGNLFLSGAGVIHSGVYSLPGPISTFVVIVATLYAFAKMSIFFASFFHKE
ncbi:hypothetical protein J2X14_001114 [Pantoea alhagi]|uniref:hypothetical protein n=1 Tax=Mixta sp. BE291 TaxID=3158787 RepID=UPI0028559FE6|nr:hypothetical protein [Pantoea alhagi]